MCRIDWRCKQATGLPGKSLRHTVALLNFGDALTFQNIDDLLIEMLFRFSDSAWRKFADIGSGDSLKAFELQIRTVAPEPFPIAQWNSANIRHHDSVENRNTLTGDPALVETLRLRPNHD